MKPSRLAQLLAPTSIAICGASTEPGTMGHRALANLLKGGFRGTLIPVNPKQRGKTIDGLRWYGSLDEYAQPIDHALLITRAGLVFGLLEDCIRAQVASVSVLSGGFAEIGSAGQALQDRIARLIQSSGMRMLGPNCLGFVNVEAAVYASPGSIFENVWPTGGPLALVSQSGAVAADLLARLHHDGVQASCWISTGNECDVSIADCLEHIAGMRTVSIIAVYLESIQDVARFSAAARLVRAAGQRIVLIRPGRTRAGADAVASHTAALVTDDALYQSLFRELGIIRVDSQRELADVVRTALAIGDTLGGLAIVGSSGGNGAMTADSAALGKIRLARISSAAQANLLSLVAECAPRNPIDITGAANQNPAVVEPFLAIVLAEPDVQTLMMIHGSGMLWRDRAEKMSAALLSLARRFPDKRIVLVAMLDADLARQLETAGIALFDDPVALVRAMGLLYGDASARQGEVVARAAARQDRLTLDENAALDLISNQGGIAVVARYLTATEHDLAQALQVLSYPIVLKAILPDVTHKTELGAVRIRIGDEPAARMAWQELSQLCRARGVPTRILIQPMVGDVVAEVLISAFVDPLLGPFVTVGAGGTLAEIIGDIVVAPAPVTRAQASDMLTRLRIHPRLKISREGQSGNLEELSAAICSVSRLIGQTIDQLAATDAGSARIMEIEINPFLLRSSESCAVDAVVRIEHASNLPGQ